MKPWASVWLVGLLLLCAVGCGKDEPMADTAPFQAAVTNYLAARSMDMRVAEFQSLEVEGETATAVCRLEEASGLYSGVGVHWRFTFRRDDRGWTALKHGPL